MELRSGTLLQGGKYKIVKKLGQGSFGITYLATAKFTTRGALGTMGVEANVAIKEFFMSDVNSRKEDGSTVEGSNGTVFSNYRKKFKKEADNLSKLEHTGIVKVYDVFDENGTTYYSMEYVDGGNLDDYISRNNPIDEAEAIDIISRICNALSFMHSKQMLHLDLKPKNIMRSANGEIYLIDFGLSKQFTANGEPESSTTIGQGTPGYAPLEQAKLIKDGTFPATLDIYALGATMYKILTGSRPLEASDILNEGFSKDLLQKYGRSEVIIGIVEKCMSPMKKDRFQQINDIIDLIPKVEYARPIETDKDISTDEGTDISRVTSRKKKRKNSKDKSSDSTKIDATPVLQQYANFQLLPTAITIRLFGENNNWCLLHVGRRSIRGEYDRYFKSIGSKKITEDEYVDLIKGLDDLISKYNPQTSDCLSQNLSIWYGENKPSDYYILNDQVMSMFCDLIPYNKQFRLYRFINGNGRSNENRESSYTEDDITPKSKFRNFLNRFSENGSIWHDLKMTIGLVIVGVGILFAIINAATGNSGKKKTIQPTTNDFHKYYQPTSAIVDSITAKAAKDVLESKQLGK